MKVCGIFLDLVSKLEGLGLLHRSAMSLSMLELAGVLAVAVAAHAVVHDADTDGEDKEQETHEDRSDGRVIVVSIVDDALEDCTTLGLRT